MKFISFFILSVHKYLFIKSCFLSFFERYKEYNSCLISFCSFCELFPAFNWAEEIGDLLSIWPGVSTFSPCPCWFCLLNLRIFLTIFNISLSFSIYFSSSLMSSVSFSKSLNPLLIIFTNLLLFFWSFVLYTDFNISLGLWNLKCFSHNS